ncbi:MAG: hypothetical protein GF334_01280 [Candidatus Altiarchaeales archaeon]|nr:hypothetical protein [Candidatus Altiarchaeales archaeon]
MRLDEGFFAEKVVLNKAALKGEEIRLQYLIDGFKDNVSITYDNIKLSLIKQEAIEKFIACLGVFGFFKYGAILPEKFDVSRRQEKINPKILDFLAAHVKDNWSEHRYQVDRMDYQAPEIIFEEEIGENGGWPIWSLPTDSDKAILTSGAGKDSLLNSLILDEAGINYDVVTYIHTYYGDLGGQKNLYEKTSTGFKGERHHVVSIKDEYYPWLRKRMKEYGVEDYVAESSNKKTRFRSEAGEVYFGSLAFLPIHQQAGINLQLLGNEKSADAANLEDQQSGELVYHQWIKGYESEKLMNNLFLELAGVHRASVLKPIHDVKIFQLLFEKARDKVYSTYSCNIVKPWCNQCEKCAYVFAGFTAYGDHEKTVKAFGADLFNESGLEEIWRELLGLEGYIPFECVGHPQETQLYLYKSREKGVGGLVVDLFEKEVLRNIKDPVKHFTDIEKTYSKVYGDHHNLPPKAWEKIKQTL